MRAQIRPKHFCLVFHWLLPYAFCGEIRNTNVKLLFFIFRLAVKVDIFNFVENPAFKPDGGEPAGHLPSVGHCIQTFHLFGNGSRLRFLGLEQRVCVSAS